MKTGLRNMFEIAEKLFDNYVTLFIYMSIRALENLGTINSFISIESKTSNKKAKYTIESNIRNSLECLE